MSSCAPSGQSFQRAFEPAILYHTLKNSALLSDQGNLPQNHTVTWTSLKMIPEHNIVWVILHFYSILCYFLMILGGDCFISRMIACTEAGLQRLRVELVWSRFQTGAVPLPKCGISGLSMGHVKLQGGVKDANPLVLYSEWVLPSPLSSSSCLACRGCVLFADMTNAWRTQYICHLKPSRCV